MQHSRGILLSGDSEEEEDVEETRSIPVEFFNKLRKLNLLLDVNIVSKENCAIPAHRLLLCAQFPNIKKYLLRKQRRTMKWCRFSTSIVQSAIDFAYTGETRIDCNNVTRLCLLAHNLGSQKLAEVCGEFINSRLDQFNLAEIWPIFNILANNKLICQCIPKVVREFDSFVDSQKCLRYTRVNYLEAILDNNWTWTISEVVKLGATVSWINASSSIEEREFRDNHFISLLSAINANKLSRSFMLGIATGELNIRLSDKSRHALLEKWKKAEESEHKRKIGEIFAYAKELDAGSFFLTSISSFASDENPRYSMPNKTNQKVVATDGYIYLLGGRNENKASSSRVYRVDPFNGEVNIMKSMLFHRDAFSAVAYGSNILVFGGHDSTRATVLNSCEKFIPPLNTWVPLPDMPTARYGTGAAHIPGLGELVVGGKPHLHRNAMNTVELLQIDASTVGAGHKWVKFAPMLCARLAPKAEFFKGTVYVAGDLGTETQTAEIFSMCDDQRGQWTLIPLCESMDSRPYSFLKEGGRLLVGTFYGSIYELEEKETRHSYNWRFLLKLENTQYLEIVKV